MKTYISAIFILIMSAVQAQSIVTDRPDQTESALTVTSGSLQIESGILIGTTDTGNTSIRQILLPTTLFRYGLTEKIELRVTNQFESLKTKGTSVEGISDMEIGIKLQLSKKENIKNTHAALISHLILPTGTEELTNGRFGITGRLAVSHDINKNMGLGYNIGYNNAGYGSGDLIYSVALGIGVNNKVGVYVETYGGFIEFDTIEIHFDGGLTYLLKDNLQLDFSFGTSATDSMNYISFGFSTNIKKK